jgi:hypothetical protein
MPLPVLDNAKPQLELVPWVSGDFIVNPTGAFNTFLLVQASMLLSPLVIPEFVSIVSVSIDISVVGSAGSVVRTGLYDAAPVTFKPNNLVADFGTVIGTGLNVVTKTPATPLQLPPGLYWQATVGQGAPVTQPTVRASLDSNPLVRPTSLPASGTNANFVAYAVAAVTGALPSPAGTLAGGAAAPYIFYGVGTGIDS